MSTTGQEGNTPSAPGVLPASEETNPRERLVQLRSLIHGSELLVIDVFLLVAFGILTFLALGLEPLAFDVPVTRELQEMQWGVFEWLMIHVSDPGFFPWQAIIPAAVIVLLLALRLPWEAAWVALAELCSGAAEVVKLIVQRPRPSADLVAVFAPLNSYSFPSGHVTSYVTFYGFIFYLAYTNLKQPVLRVIVLVITGGLILLVGPSRIWLGQHWTSDVLGGYTLGFFMLLILIQLHRYWASKRITPPTATTEQPTT